MKALPIVEMIGFVKSFQSNMITYRVKQSLGVMILHRTSSCTSFVCLSRPINVNIIQKFSYSK